MAPARTRPSTSTATQSRVPTELPEYQPPAHPINLYGQQSLKDLPRSHKLDSLKHRLQAANNHLTDAAAEINDRFQERNAQNEKRKGRRAAFSSSQEENEENERKLQKMRKTTEEMTENLDRGIRRVIDGGEEIKLVEEVLRELNANVTAGRIAPTQSTLEASQFAETRRRPAYNADNEDMDEWADGYAVKGTAEVLDERKDQHRAVYSELTMTERYASHNDYIGFKKIVHDAHFPGEEAPPMPHASTWFADGSGTQMSSNNGLKGTQLDEEEDDDDDLVMASERISVKCPITLTEMKDPVSSTKCPHTFERQAFLEMIGINDGHGRIGNRAMRCPVAGCEEVSRGVERILKSLDANCNSSFSCFESKTYAQMRC